MSDKPLARLDAWTAEPPPSDVQVALEWLRRAPDVRRIAVMPDVHLAWEVCIGTVVATARLVYPAAVGGDIGCGMIAEAFDARAACVEDSETAAALLERLSASIPILRHARRGTARLPARLEQTLLGAPELEAAKRRTAALQLGTLGRGNHFVELQSDEEGRLWAMVHSGSRGIGQAIRSFHEERAERVRGGLFALDSGSPAGRAYLADVQWALEYAEENRARLLDALGLAVRDVLGALALPASRIACHHNSVRREMHGTEELWVHRKGAISAAEGEPGIIPGSMGTTSYHVVGRGCPGSLSSSSHGAGRRMDRTRARRLVTEADLVRQMDGVWFDTRLTRGLREEAPEAYKDISKVMRAQKRLTKIVGRMRPVLSFKGV